MPSKVYYNSACPVCNAGIKDQRQRMEKCGIKDIEWVDVHNNPGAVSEVNSSLESGIETLVNPYLSLTQEHFLVSRHFPGQTIPCIQRYQFLSCKFKLFW